MLWRLNPLVGPSFRDRLVLLKEIVGVPVLAPAGDGVHGFLFEFLCAITEVEKDSAIVYLKASDHKHDLEKCAHGVT